MERERCIVKGEDLAVLGEMVIEPDVRHQASTSSGQ
jgi:hypothetical protein